MTRTAARTESATRTGQGTVRGAHYMHGLDALRVICSFTVVYTHVAGWARMHGTEFWLAELVEGGVVGPLHLSSLLGFVGVGSFLLVSGVVVTHVGFGERPGQFLARRAVRLFPAFWIAILVGWLLIHVGVLVRPRPVTGEDLWLNLALLNFTVPGAIDVDGVTWTLTVQVVFYAFVAATMFLLRGRPWLPPAIGAALVSVLLSFTNTQDTTALVHLRTIATFLPVLFIGQLVMLTRRKEISPPLGIVLGAVHFLLAVRAAATWPDTPNGEAYPRTLLILVLILLLCSRASGRLVRSRWVRTIADRTYAIYLLHFPLVLGTLNLLAEPIGFLPALLIGLLVLAGAVELLYRYVERPVASAYRRWERTRSRRSARTDHGVSG
ncbi:acyltransferase family protein [Amycolatopsis cihanbeyliensis]|uniref:Peptidoglycan/LPS O-acetylase OafA/YrhL n=1 Tax=Amycolatopsis cihanbeyliensis TaxID=1128664 RepID=A0A542DM25_AMYCI|nr:acyltransferase [Amycolatopsis cihanbeyliensis]TQJ04035.1 peptidoglycan/LPS O-acetylase OafA/YrhL [Amycolatopsis cihanbeyliensis]